MPEFKEGPEAKEKFEQTMRTLFQASKPTTRKKTKDDTPSLRKPKRPDKN